MRTVEEAYLPACLGVDERRQESGIGMGKVESEVFNMMADAGEGLDPERVGKGVGCEG